MTSLIKAGVWVEDDRAFLEGMSNVNFERIVRQANLSKEEEEGVGSSANESKTVTRQKSPLGEDVTDDFPACGDKFHVFKNKAGKYQVTTSKDVKKPLGSAPLDAEQVPSFLREAAKAQG